LGCLETTQLAVTAVWRKKWAFHGA
jgi:hypothetical protein